MQLRSSARKPRLSPVDTSVSPPRSPGRYASRSPARSGAASRSTYLLVTSSTAKLFVQQQGSAGWRPLGLADAINFWGGGACSPLSNSRGSPLRFVLLGIFSLLLVLAVHAAGGGRQLVLAVQATATAGGGREQIPPPARHDTLGLIVLLAVLFLFVLSEVLRIRTCLSRGDLLKSPERRKLGDNTATFYRIDVDDGQEKMPVALWVSNGEKKELRVMTKLEHDARKNQQDALERHYWLFWRAVVLLVLPLVLLLVVVGYLAYTNVEWSVEGSRIMASASGHFECRGSTRLVVPDLIMASALLFFVNLIRNSLLELRVQTWLRAQGLRNFSMLFLCAAILWWCYWAVSLGFCLQWWGVVGSLPEWLVALVGAATSAAACASLQKESMTKGVKWGFQMFSSSVINTSVARIPMEKQLVWLSKNRFVQKCLFITKPLEERLKGDSFDSTVTMQLNTWEPSTDTSNADGLLSFRTLAVLDMAQLTAGLRDGTDAALLEELLFAASMTTDRHGFLFLAEESNQKSRIMTMLLNAVSSHFRLGFMMRDVDPDSVVEREYCIGLTNEAGERVDHQKIRLFVTAKDTLEQLRACNFEQLSTDMEDEQKQSSAAEKKGRWDKHMVWDEPIAPTPSPHQERKGAHFRRMTSKEQCGGLRPEFEGGRVNRKRWQTLVEMAHLKAANNDLIWDMTICIPKHQASQATARHAPGRETMHEMYEGML